MNSRSREEDRFVVFTSEPPFHRPRAFESQNRSKDKFRFIDLFYKPTVSAFLSVLFAFVFCAFVAVKLNLHSVLKEQNDFTFNGFNSTSTKLKNVNLITLTPSPFSEAVCLDGSPPGFHFKRGSGKGRNNWILIFEGGGWCFNEKECEKRRKTHLGSSHHFSNQFFLLQGMFSDDENLNPHFHNWNVIEFKYCDGGSFSGYKKKLSKHNGEIIFFRGKKIFDALMEYLFKNENIRNAKQVILGGWSAGGLAVLSFCDHVNSLFPGNVHYSCLVDASLFMNIKDVSGEYSFQEKFKNVFSMQNLKQTLNKKCINERPESLQYQCFFPQYSISYVRSPIFFINSFVDSWMVHNILAPPESDPTNLILRRCLFDNKFCNEESKLYYHRLKSSMLNALLPFKDDAQVGYFLNACNLHVTMRYDKYWSKLTINNKTLYQAFFEWHQGRGTRVVQLIDDGCNSNRFH